MEEMKLITKVVKTTLASKFGYKNVSTRLGRGTASGWIDAKVVTDRPTTCTCNTQMRRCDACWDLYRATNTEIKHELDKHNAKLYTYDDDMGVEHSCFMLHLNYAN